MKAVLTLIFSSVLVFCSTAQSFLHQESWSAIWNEGEEKSFENPGWYQQWYEMKKDADGNIRRLPYENIRQHALNGYTRESLLFNFAELGPKNIGGRTRAIILDHDNYDKVLAGGVTGGLWRSDDKGETWVVVNDKLENLNISGLAQDYFNRDVIYASTSEPTVGFIGNGVYRSMDRGATFEHLPSTDPAFFDYIFRVKTSPVDSGRVYIATRSNGLHRSDNFGDSLSLVFVQGLAVNDVEITPSGGVWLTVNSVGLFYSPSGDSGTFVQISNGFPSAGSFHRIEMAIAPSDTNTIYVALENMSYNGIKGIYKTSDYGQSWIEVSNPDLDYGFYMSQSWYSVAIAVKPDDPDFVVFGVGDLCFSLDGGEVWKKCQNIHVDHHEITFNPEEPKEFYLGEDGGIYRYNTDNMSFTFTPVNDGYSTIQYYTGCFAPTGLNGWAGSQDNGTHSCKNGDGEFFDIFGGDGAYCAINQQNPNIGYVSYQNGTIHRTDEATQNVPSFYPVMNEMDADGNNEIDDGAWFINPFQIHLYNGDYLGFATLQKLWHSLDGGYSWQPAMNSANGDPYAIGISKSFSPTVYIGGSSGTFYRIDDAYNSFPGDETNLSSKVPSTITNDFIHSIIVHPGDSSICYLALSNFSNEPRMWKVTEGTSANPVFTPISGDFPAGLPVNYLDVDPLRPDSFFIAGTDFGAYVSADAGNHWHKIDELPNVITYEVRVRPWDRRVFFYTHGRGMWTATLDSFNVGIFPITESSFSANLIPNPFSHEVTVKTDMPAVDLIVRDVNGRIVFQEQKVRPNQSLDLSRLPAGIYYAEFRDGESAVIKKIVKAE